MRAYIVMPSGQVMRGKVVAAPYSEYLYNGGAYPADCVVKDNSNNRLIIKIYKENEKEIDRLERQQAILRGKLERL